MLADDGDEHAAKSTGDARSKANALAFSYTCIEPAYE
jgi:hypothetical protein